MEVITKVGSEQIPLIQELIFEIYPHTYGNILSEAQIRFMLAQMYSDEGLTIAMASGQKFYLLFDECGKALGLIALQDKDEIILRIEKLYLLPAQQGRGLGRRLISFAEDEAKRRGQHTLELNVNRGNSAYHFYLKQGFEVLEEVDIPYYEYVLDDYVMQKTLDTPK